MPVSEKAFAKINLLLLVKHKRPDGYHELETVYQSIALHDTLVFYTADDEQVSLSCDCPGLSVGEDNLALQAALMLKKYYEVRQGARIVLKKDSSCRRTVGGSSDAAAALRGLLRLCCPARTACFKKLRRHWVPMCPFACKAARLLLPGGERG